MNQAAFFFHPPLDHLLQRRNRTVWFSCAFEGRQSIKHLIESLGVPHTEIGWVRVNGQNVELDTLAQPDDEIEVYPLQPEINHLSGDFPPGFVLDVHLGRLAIYLRRLGFDTLYWKDAEDAFLAAVSDQEQRVLLTRDRGLLKRKLVKHGILIDEGNPDRQILLVLERLDLWKAVRPFTRCQECNTPLERVPIEWAAARLPAEIVSRFSEYLGCPGCDRVYWQGSHYERLKTWVTQVLSHQPQQKKNPPD